MRGIPLALSNNLNLTTRARFERLTPYRNQIKNQSSDFLVKKAQELFLDILNLAIMPKIASGITINRTPFWDLSDKEQALNLSMLYLSIQHRFEATSALPTHKLLNLLLDFLP